MQERERKYPILGRLQIKKTSETKSYNRVLNDFYMLEYCKVKYMKSITIMLLQHY